MKSAYYILPLAALALVGCEPEGDKTLAELRSERDSLNTVSAQIQDRLMTIEGEIAKLDSTMDFTTVSTLMVTRQPFAHYFQVYGSVEADRNVTLFAEAAGLIENIHVREGQSVSQGQKLISIDDDVIRRNVAEVETSLELAKTLYEKQTNLWNQGIGSEVQYLESKNQYESLENRLATLNAQLRMSNLTAPFSGVVDEIFPKTGEYAGPGSPMIRLLNMSQVYVTADIPESYVNRVETGTEVSLYFRALEDTVTGKIIQVGQFINPDNRTFRIKVGINDASGRYKPNLMSSVTICDYSTDSTVVLPSHIVQQNQEGRSFVFVYSPTDEFGLGTVKRQFLRTGMSYDGRTEILEGLTGDEWIVDRGARSVQDGERVREIE